VINLEATLQLLASNEVEFVIVGGVAGSIHGSTIATFDLDLCYARHESNLARLAEALAPLRPRLRGAPEELPFIWDVQTLKHGLNFTLQTDLGDIDLLGEITGIGSFAKVLACSVPMVLFGLKCNVLSLDSLIVAKRSAGRAKDLLALPELEALREIAQSSND
jgi:hypothetical protein